MVKPFGPHHCARRSASVQAFHTSSRGASKTRLMMNSRPAGGPASASAGIGSSSVINTSLSCHRGQVRAETFQMLPRALDGAVLLGHPIALRGRREERPHGEPDLAAQVLEG